MTQKNSSQSLSITYYISPTNKIHSSKCRYCKSGEPGWQKADSFLAAVDTGAQPCRVCCPPTEELTVLKQIPKSDLTNCETEDLKVNNNKKNSSIIDNQAQANKSESSNNEQIKDKKTKNKVVKKKETKPKEEKKRYKILAGNGCHQAIAEIQGILVPPANENSSHVLILPDGSTLDAIFKNARLKWLAYNQESILGSHWFRGYPKMKDNKLVAFQIISWDGGMPTNEKGWETWEFIGVWTLQKTLTVQRSMAMDDVRKSAKETGFIKKFKYTFTNTHDFLKSKKLWSGYVYKILCRREGNTLKIQKVIPYACPRLKPLPRGSKFNPTTKS